MLLPFNRNEQVQILLESCRNCMLFPLEIEMYTTILPTPTVSSSVTRHRIKQQNIVIIEGV